MIPINPSSALTRSPTFIREEWSAFFDDRTGFDPAKGVAGGWCGILYGNLALIDPSTAWAFFTRNDFRNEWIDGGASRTWYLALAAGKTWEIVKVLEHGLTGNHSAWRYLRADASTLSEWLIDGKLYIG